LIRSTKSMKASFVKLEQVCQWFAPGAQVVIHRVPQFNGQLATVESFVALKGSYFLKFEDEQVRQFKPETMCRWFPSGAKVLLLGLENKELDEHIACVRGFDQERGRYLVHLAQNQKRTSLLRCEHLHTLLPVGQVVRFEGLQSNTDLNGKFGKVMKKFDETCGRYSVRVFGGTELEQFPAQVLCEALPGEYNEADAVEEEEQPYEASDAESSASIDSGDLLDHMPAQDEFECSSSDDSSDSCGFRKKRSKGNSEKMTPKTAIPRGMLRRMVEKTMKGIPTEQRSTSSA